MASGRFGEEVMGPLGEDKEGLQLGPLRVGCFVVLLFDVLIGTPKSCEAVCFFFLPEARLGYGLGELRGGGHGPKGKTRKGLSWAPSGWSVWQSFYLMFQLETPKAAKQYASFSSPKRG